MRLIAILSLLLTGSLASATILPPNDLYKQDHLFWADPNINEQQFNEIIDGVMAVYQPIVAEHGASLSTNKRWTDSTVNASAQQMGSSWVVNMYGGLARRPEVTPDGFALVVCHELGHHLAGFPFYDETWAASEGQSDYFATQSCARHIWGSQTEINARSRATVNPTAKAGCDAAYSTEDAQNLCYRIAMGGHSLASLLSALGGSTVSFDTPDTSKVNSTQTSHPRGQCRLDTYYQGGLCTVDFDMHLIPGRNNAAGQGSEAAELIAAKNSCTRAAFYNTGVRPFCWYKPQVQSLLGLKTVNFEELRGNGNGAIEPGETITVNPMLENLSTKAYEGITASVTSADATFEIVRGTAAFPKIEAGATATPNEAFEVVVGRNAACGAKGKLNLEIQVGTGRSVTEQIIQIGKIVKDINGKNETAMPIPDNNPDGIMSAIEVATSDNFMSADVTVNIEHTYIGDLTVTLISPDNQKFVLHNRKGGSADNLKETFSVDLPRVTSNGTWNLQVSDSARSDEGRLVSWSAVFGKAVCE